MSLLDAAERFASIDRSQVVLDPRRCLHAQDQYSGCAACYDVCPAGAITAGKPPSLDAEKCQSCFACLPACPVGACRADDDVISLLSCAAHIEEEKPVELVCGLHPHPQTGAEAESIGIQIHGCLAGLGTGTYVMLSVLGPGRLAARTDACRACKWQTLGPEIHRQAERADRLLAAWGRDHTVTCIDRVELSAERTLWDSRNPPLSRRDLFRLMARQGQVAVARAMEDSITESKRQTGRDRLRLLAASAHLAKPSSEVDLDGFGFAALSISAACTACGACGKACPTAALRFEKNDEALTFSITFSPRDCIGCDLCDHVCLADAVSIDHEPTFAQVFGPDRPAELACGPLARCERCKTLMAKRDGARLCPLCEYRRAHPFGSLLPKKVIKGTPS